jgi:hypothetical protein
MFCHLLKLKVHNRIHNSPPVPIPNQINLIYTIPFCKRNTNFNLDTLSISKPSQIPLAFRFCVKNFVGISGLSHMCYTCRSLPLPHFFALTASCFIKFLLLHSKKKKKKESLNRLKGKVNR